MAQLLTSMDDLARLLPPGSPPVLVLGATNRPDSIDPAVRRAGRFDREFGLNVPSLGAREEILRVLCEPMRLAEDTDFLKLARNTPGFVGADLKALVSEAGLNAISRAFHAIAAPASDPASVDGAPAVVPVTSGAATGAAATVAGHANGDVGPAAAEDGAPAAPEADAMDIQGDDSSGPAPVATAQAEVAKSGTVASEATRSTSPILRNKQSQDALRYGMGGGCVCARQGGHVAEVVW